MNFRKPASPTPAAYAAKSWVGHSFCGPPNQCYLDAFGAKVKKMNIVIKNCNNIVNGEISLKENLLNIKYAINGTGKSSISKSILYYGHLENC
jgi:hypothetical protein